MQTDSDSGMKEYHRLFGHETHDNRVLFELLTVAVFQAGLSWRVAAGKIPVFRQVFADFDYHKVAGYDVPEFEAIMHEPAMIKNPRKIRAVISNSRAMIKLAPEFTDFNEYLWHFTEQQVWVMSIEPEAPLNQQSSLGTFVAKDMKKHGFKFVGPTTVQLLLIAAGIIRRLDQ